MRTRRMVLRSAARMPASLLRWRANRETSMILQLNPTIPVWVEARDGAWPGGNGYAIALMDYSQEHNTLWLVAMDDNGQMWWVPQSHIRMQFNPSMGRIK
jgi:hypothetical protein